MTTTKLSSTVKTMTSMLVGFVIYFFYAVLVHGFRKEQCFLLVIALWLVSTLIVYWVTKRRGGASS